MSSWKISEETNCFQNCHYTEYEAIQKYEHCSFDNSRGRSYIQLQLFLTGGELKVEKFVPSYTGNNFIADVGGYLGLLLGVSLYSVYDVLIMFVRKKTKKNGKCNKRSHFKKQKQFKKTGP